jgi:predicted phage-related endonuclease
MHKRDYIGSSDVALIRGGTVFGKSAFTLWHALRSGGADINTETNFRMDLGNMLERDIIKGMKEQFAGEIEGYAMRPGPSVQEPPIYHPDHKFIAVHPDEMGVRWKDKSGVLLEAKVVTAYEKANAVKSGEIPDYYRCQLMLQMAVLKAHHNLDEVRGFIGFFDLVNFEPHYFELTATAQELDDLIVEVVGWYTLHVVGNVMPPVSGDDAGKIVAEMSEGKEPGTNEKAGGDEEEILSTMVELKATIKRAESNYDELEAMLRKSMVEGNFVKLWSDKASYSYSPTAGRKSFDKDKFNASYPGVYDLFTKAGTPSFTSRLTVKKVK